MGAASVTGVGLGSAEGSNKMNEHVSLGVSRLIGTRVVAAGVATTSSGAATVTFPQVLPESNTNYIVMCDSVGSATRAYVNTMTDSSSQFASFTIVGSGTQTVHWMVVKIGFDA